MREVMMKDYEEDRANRKAFEPLYVKYRNWASFVAHYDKTFAMGPGGYVKREIEQVYQGYLMGLRAAQNKDSSNG